MPRINPAIEPRKELKRRITKSVYDRLVAECNECGCSLNGVATLAIGREIASRRLRRQQAANHAVLAGQIDIEGKVHA